MPSRESVSRVPSYRRHKASGQAGVTLNGREIYLGKWGTKASKAEYDRLIGQWLGSGRSLPHGDEGVTIAELALAYWRFAKRYYCKDGKPTSALDGVRQTLRHLRGLFGSTPVTRFGPRSLMAIRQLLLESGRLNRGTVNKRVDTVKRVLK